MASYLVKFVADLFVLSVPMLADSSWQARRKAEIMLSDDYGIDISLVRWVDVEVTKEGEWL
jgi:hypothetical protein